MRLWSSVAPEERLLSGAFFWDNGFVPKRRLLVLLIILVVVALGVGAFFYFRPQITEWVASITDGQDEGKEEETCPGQVYTNTRQGYTVCYPSGWYNREFGYSQLDVGFDSFPIPEAGEYGGVFTVSVSRQASTALIAQYLQSLKNPTTSTVTMDTSSGVRVEGTLPSDDVFFPNYRQAVIVFEKFGRTYTVTMLSSPDGYAVNLPLYEAFVASWKFVEGTAAAPWGKDIYLDTPWPGDEVSVSFRLAGSAQDAFENTLVVRLVTTEGTVLFQDSIIYNASEMGELGYFDIPITFSTSSKSGTLEVYHTSPKDGAILDLVSVPLTFR